MSDELTNSRKAAAKIARTAEALTGALKQLESAVKHMDDRPFAITSTVADVRKALKPILPTAADLSELPAYLNQLEEQGKIATERGRARLAAELHDELTQRGLALQGRLPTPTVGPMTLEFLFGNKPAVKIYYGPKVTLLRTVPLDPKTIADAVLRDMQSLNGDTMDDLAFLTELHTAWKVALIRLNLSPGERVPIRAVHEALAAGRQPPQAWEPLGRGVVEYGAVRFSHDLTRLRTRSAAFGELALTVATREQTKKSADHLWVDGTHYAFISFR